MCAIYNGFDPRSIAPTLLTPTLFSFRSRRFDDDVDEIKVALLIPRQQKRPRQHALYYGQGELEQKSSRHFCRVVVDEIGFIDLLTI